MKYASMKDIWRTMRHEKKRFFALMIITILGVITLTGIKASCIDLRYTADQFFDEQKLFDLSIQSTLGLTKEDVDVLKAIDGVEYAEGTYSQTVTMQIAGKNTTSELKALSSYGINQPYIQEGKLPVTADEIAVTKAYLKASEKKIGDTLTVTINDMDREFHITASVIDPTDITSVDGAASFRSTSTTDYIFFTKKDALISPVYTSVYLILNDTAPLLCYSDDYTSKVDKVSKYIEETIKPVQEAARNPQAPATWYIQNRNSLSGYSNVQSDSESIETIGNVFPIVFLLVAILISLTTITRMVEEERGLIGTYKALGYTDREIRRKYVMYAGFASFIGGIIGDLGGFILLPKIIFTVFNTMYQFPAYQLQFNLSSGIGGIVLFVGAILVATFIACKSELMHNPAVLMRPTAPRAGSKVLLERWSYLWNRLTFLNKVTARNLFRYKKRLMMTIGGIMGCTALLICGFAIKDSMTDLMPLQYEYIYKYDFMAVNLTNDISTLTDTLNSNDIESYQQVYTTMLKVTGGNGNNENVQLIVVPDGHTLDRDTLDCDTLDEHTLDDNALDAYIALDSIDGGALTLPEDGILVTRNLSIILDFEVNDSLTLQNMALNQVTTPVRGIVENYLGNCIYMKASVYNELFGEFAPNAALANFSDQCNDTSAFIDNLSEQEGITSVTSITDLKEDFSTAFSLVNMVVYIIIILAACLAFVVLFTLSTTNISERVRELSTIKVLGFFDREVHSYVNKETLILTGIGIALGLPLGTVLGNGLTQALKMPAVYFAVSIHPISYVISAGLAFVFALFVNLLTNRSLDMIDPVEALKSVE